MLQKPDPGISATPTEQNLRYFNVVIAGPQDSAYDGARVAALACNTRSRNKCGQSALDAVGPDIWSCVSHEATQLILGGGIVTRADCELLS